MHTISKNKTLIIKYRLIVAILLLIGCQQFPVLNAGGSTLKIYEVCAFFLLFKYVLKIRDKYCLILFLLFVITPCISLLYSYLFIDYPHSFFTHYMSEKEMLSSFKFKYYIFPILQLFYMWINYAAINAIYSEDRLYVNIDKIIKYVIIIGTIISLYSLLSIFIGDVIRYLPSLIQKKNFIRGGFRVSGFSQEPGNYALYQGWILILVFYAKNLFAKNKWRIICLINLLAYLFTFSSLIAIMIGVTMLIPFVFRYSFKYRIALIGIILLFSVTISYIIYRLGVWDFFQYMLLEKLENFFSSPNHTLDSGAFRSYTSRLGYAIFNDFPLIGVGLGMSQYYMHVYDPQMGIIAYGEELVPGMTPQNVFSITFAEMGILGGSFLLIFILLNLYKTWKYRKYNRLTMFLFIGTLYNILCLFSQQPIYSMFLWVYIAVSVGYTRFLKNINNEDIYNNSYF